MFFSEENSYIHWELPQLKSQREALALKQSAITRISDDTVQVKGSGADAYTVSLDSCTCPDFLKNKKGKAPCKHIYWLAMEKGLFALPPMSEECQRKAEKEIGPCMERWKQMYLSGGISLSRYVAIVEAFSKK